VALYCVSVDAIALSAATAKSVIELGTGSGDRARIVQWSVTFDGTSATATPVKVEVGRFSAAVTTATSFTPVKLDAAEGAAAITAKHSTSTEGAGTADAVEIYRVPPTSGMVLQYPLGREWVVGTSGFWRMRLTAAATVNATVQVTWDE
jgi:hypothetical protein